MIVQKFGGTSVADADRMNRAAAIVAAERGRAPVVVVSALGGVTDLLTLAIEESVAGRKDALEPVLAELERRHRWALAGACTDARRRHDLELEAGASFEDLRQLLRSVRVLGEVTARARDTLLAFGERLSSRILVAALHGAGVDAEWLDPTAVLATDATFGGAAPDPDRTRELCSRAIVPVVESGRVPVVGGFVGASADGVVTTLGRGGSDTSAAVIGAAIDAEEIQIWTDVDGLMTADPRLVPGARPLERLSFAEAAELAFYGAKVLHPASIEPAVRRNIPVRVRNAANREAPGTEIVAGTDRAGVGIASIASRSGLRVVRVRSRRMDVDPDFLREIADRCRTHGCTPDVMVSSEIGAAVALRTGDASDRWIEDVRAVGEVEVREEMAVVCVVGIGLDGDPGTRATVLEALSALAPTMVSAGGSGTAVAAVIEERGLAEAVRAVHRRFFET